MPQHVNQLAHLIDILKHMRTRPEMYFGEVDPIAATHYLNGFESALAAWFGWTRIRECRDQVEEARGWSGRSGWNAASRMAERGIQPPLIVDELLVIQIEVLRRLEPEAATGPHQELWPTQPPALPE